jgi:hypothetical protein
MSKPVVSFPSSLSSYGATLTSLPTCRISQEMSPTSTLAAVARTLHATGEPPLPALSSLSGVRWPEPHCPVDAPEHSEARGENDIIVSSSENHRRPCHVATVCAHPRRADHTVVSCSRIGPLACQPLWLSHTPVHTRAVIRRCGPRKPGHKASFSPWCQI